MSSYLGLLLTAFLSATLLPGSSEALLSGLVLLEEYDPFLLLAFATTGNVLGAVFNWFCGLFLISFQDRRWFPVSKTQITKAMAWYQKYGLWSLLLAWMPILGDPLTVVAGILRAPFLPFLLMVTAGKLVRYWLIIKGIQIFL